MRTEAIGKLGEPDIRIAGLSIWIHQRQSPEAEDHWDGNWLIITACCIDQSYLPKLIHDCRKALDKYPIKNDRSETEEL